MTKYDAGDEMRGRVRDTFSENIANQAELLNYFTKNPSNLRTRKEREEMMSEGLTNDEGLITVTKPGLPASQEIIDKVMKRVDERMLLLITPPTPSEPASTSPELNQETLPMLLKVTTDQAKRPPTTAVVI